MIPSNMRFFLAALLAMTCITLGTSLPVATGGDLYDILVSALDAPDKPNTIEQNQALKRVARNTAQWLMGAQQYNNTCSSSARRHAILQRHRQQAQQGAQQDKSNTIEQTLALNRVAQNTAQSMNGAQQYGHDYDTNGNNTHWYAHHREQQQVEIATEIVS